jgi:hypothetical protein
VAAVRDCTLIEFWQGLPWESQALIIFGVLIMMLMVYLNQERAE